MSKSSFLSFGRRAQAALLATVSAAAALMLSAGYVNATSSNWAHDDEAEIAKLPLCYARATDTIGRGNVALGKLIYASCFTPNAKLAVYNPGTPFNGPPTFSTVGTDDWADFAKATFDASGYVATQHLNGNIEVRVVNSNYATVSTYLHATHVLPDGTIDVANGTYEDEVIRVNGKWKIKTRTLKIIDFPHLGDP